MQKCDAFQIENNFGIRPALFGIDRGTTFPDFPL